LPLVKRYAAFLRGVSPMNARMPELKRAFEQAGFRDVKTLLSSGNVVFDARETDPKAIERKAEATMKKELGSSFMTFVRSVDALRALLEADPYDAFALEPDAKRVVTFLHRAPSASARAKLNLPVELHGARILAVRGDTVLSAYVRSERGPVFMTLLEKTFGKDITTRTWQTVQRAAK
jgi:uncharacterized protein (DUF1697 family)